jgi:hypothetical protein
VNIRVCSVSFTDHRGVRHSVEVQAESLFEAAVLAIQIFRQDPWLERVGPATVLDVEHASRRRGMPSPCSKSSAGSPGQRRTRRRRARKRS